MDKQSMASVFVINRYPMKIRTRFFLLHAPRIKYALHLLFLWRTFRSSRLSMFDADLCLQIHEQRWQSVYSITSELL
jgi:hypothetical protein